MKELIAKCYGLSDDDIRTIESNLKIKISYMTDRNPQNQKKYTKLVLSTYKAVQKYQNLEVDGFLISAFNLKTMNSMVDELVVYGVSKEDIFLLVNNSYVGKEYTVVPLLSFRYLSYIEFHVADHCNLNCKGCVHFSPLVSKNVFPEYAEFEKDIRKLKTLVEYIEEIHILGGEPLLNPELSRYLELTREVFRNSRIMIVTNGLLVRKMGAELIDSILNNSIEVSISLYKPMLERIDDAIYFLDEHNIVYHVSEPVDSFSYTFDEKGGHSIGVKRLNCSCPNLYRGKLAICPPIAYAKYFNDAFGEQFLIPENQGLIDIYDENMTYHKLKELLYTPVDICDKCLFISKEDMVPLKWEQIKGRNKEDFVYRG